MRRLALGLMIGLMGFQAQAYEPMLLSPGWFKGVVMGLAENNKNVWRGNIVDYVGGLTIIVETLDGTPVTVNLLHLAAANGGEQQTNVQTLLMQGLVGRQVYVLGRSDKDVINAKILDGRGEDINLSLIANGSFDVNVPSLLLKDEKQQYMNAARFARYGGMGIWHRN